MMAGRGTGYCSASYSPGHRNQTPGFSTGSGIGRCLMTGGRGIGNKRGAGRVRGTGWYFSRRNAFPPYCARFNDPRGVY